MQAIIEAGTASVEWVREEFAGVDLSDKRLDRRLIKTAEQLVSSPASPINEACGDWASTQGAYRLFDNGNASCEAILEPHIQATLKRMAGVGGPVLVMQDTVFFSYGQHPKTRGLGPIGNSNSEHERGLIMHNALAFTAAGVPLGLLSQTTWARQEVPEEGYQENILRLQCTAIEEKESSKWLQALHETVGRAPRGVQVITVADRESDFFEFFTQAEEQRARFLIRARTDRMLVPEESAGFESILEAYASADVLGTLTVKIPGNGKRKARTAQVEVRVAPVTIKPPQRRGAAKASGSTEPISVNVIGATESAPPEGQAAISWVLLTNLPVPDFDCAAEKVQWYAKRWGIGVSREGHVFKSVKVRPRSKDSGLVAWEAPLRESKTVEPSDNILSQGVCAKHPVVSRMNAEVASLHAFPVAETVDIARKQQVPTETSPMRRHSPAGYQRRQGANEDVETGEALDVRGRNLLEET